MSKRDPPQKRYLIASKEEEETIVDWKHDALESAEIFNVKSRHALFDISPKTVKNLEPTLTQSFKCVGIL